MCVGGYLFVTSVVGLSGADFARRCRCGSTRRLLLVAALAQLAVFLALSLGPGADGDALAGLDVTGAEASSGAHGARAPTLARVSLAVFALQLVDLALASALARGGAAGRRGRSRLGRGGRRALREAREALPGRGSAGRRDGGWSGGWSTRRNETETETETDFSALDAPLLDRAGDGDGDDVGASSDAESESAVWARRMRSKYNLDVTRLAYDPERAALGVPEPVADRARGKCVVM